MTSPRRFLDPIEARDHAGHMDNTPRKRPSSAKPNNIHRNPLTGVGVDDETRKTYGRRKGGCVKMNNYIPIIFLLIFF